MASYVVMEPPSRGSGEEAVLVRDGFSLIAFLLPVVWFLWHRLWIEALAVAAVAAALAGLGALAGFGNCAPFLSLLVSVAAGLEAPALRVAALRRRGWREWGVVEAEDAEDAEIRYLAEAYGGEAVPEGLGSPVPVAPVHARPAPAPVLGLFSYPGRG